MIEWRKKHTIIIVLALLLAALACYFSYVLFVQPKNLELTSLENQIETENKLIESLQKSTGSSTEEALLSAVELQKILPVSPFEEQFLLELEKAETMSSSEITFISFQDGGTVESEDQGDEMVEAYDEKLDPDSEDSNEAEQTESLNTEAIPEGLEKLTVELEVKSPSYYELEDFIKILENTNRITQIESLQVEGFPELIQIVEDPDTTYEYKVVVSTYYFPTLDELREQLPPFFAPSPSEKENPFTDIIEEKDEE
ncbi:type IV pilus assembly protein PilO [Metabacillus crassostreae]|uniref:hypothetical protein n=1 Tax=Metabacillus crassostreae TaxID=929098 RepID=UPI001957C8A7|nr:hypothetical protein [Metabacillus crassostreae]MBM7605745.1 type IV pilus assembly protein PilO [Metabacillus crassostreae]